MNYTNIYNGIISKAQNRAKPDVYTEKHHILPKALGGKDVSENLVVLTAREHFLAHYCLWKFSAGNAKYKMAKAFNMMRMNPKGSARYVNSRLYTSLREDLAKALSKLHKGKKHSDEARAKMSAAHKGKKTSDETKAKMSATRLGKKHSDEAKAKIGAASKGRPSAMKGKTHSEKALAKMSASHKGFKHSDESKTKIRAAHKGKVISAETKAKISAATTGVKKKPQSAEHKAKISAAKLGKKHSAERKATQRKAVKDWWAKRRELKLAA